MTENLKPECISLKDHYRIIASREAELSEARQTILKSVGVVDKLNREAGKMRDVVGAAKVHYERIRKGVCFEEHPALLEEFCAALEDYDKGKK